MTGLLALVGGREHTPGCEPIDQTVLAWTRRPTPLVVIVPLASSRRTRDRTVDRAVAWWEALGARTRVAPLEPDGTSAALAGAHVVVLPGGVPDRLHQRLTTTPAGAHVLAVWRRGAALVGSSSGAMVLGGFRQSVRPPFAVTPGYGLLPDVAVAPHHELRVPRLVTTARGLTHPYATIVGIDEATALVGRRDRFVVKGVGRVTLRRATHRQVFHPGQVVDLRALRPTSSATERTRTAPGVTTPTRSATLA